MALLSEFTIAFGLMFTVLYFSNHHRLDRYTGLFVGLLIATYISLEVPILRDERESRPNRGLRVSSHDLGRTVDLPDCPATWHVDRGRVVSLEERTDGGEVLQTAPQQ